MMDFKNKGFSFIIFLFSLLTYTVAIGQPLTLKISGDAMAGYHVDIYNNNQLLVTNKEELSLQLFNHDLSTVANLPSWKGQKWSGNTKRISLQRDEYINEFDANLSVTVTYEVVNANVIKKTIELFQPSMPGMYYILQQTARPAEKPQRYVSFEYDNFPGGFVHEMFPSVGFITPDNSVVGFLTDAGYKNQYTRNTRRRFSGRGGGFVGMRRLPDPNLFSIADASQRAANDNYIRQTFGELYNLDAGTTTILKTPDSFQKEGNAEVIYQPGLISITGHPGGRAGVEMIAPLKDQKVYTISFWCKGNTPVALKLFRLKNKQKTIELENGVKYIDNFPAVDSEWTFFKGSILVPYIENDSVSMFIGTQSGKECHLQIKDLQFTEHQPQAAPYNILPLGEKVTKTTFVFLEPWKSHQQFMIASQSRLAEGKGFKGSQIEKMLYANFNMLTWITVTGQDVYKYLGELNGNNKGNDDAASNKIYIRWADVMLWKAEALNETGSYPAAIALINKIRERARLTITATGTHAPAGTLPDRNVASTDKVQIKAWLVQERRVELGFESQRFNDLKRWGIAKTFLTGLGKNFQDKDNVYPIPQGEIDRSGGTITQNAGY